MVAAFSLATDLGLGQPMDHVLRTWLIAVRLGERMDLEPQARQCLYYVAMLGWTGCVADTPELAVWFGDDIAFRRDSFGVDRAGLSMLGLGSEVCGPLQQVFTRWDGKGVPAGIGGEAISPMVSTRRWIWLVRGGARSSTRPSWTSSARRPARCSPVG